MILLAKICLPLDTVTNATSDSTNSLCCELEGSIVPSHRACKRHWKDSRWNRVKPKREKNIKVLLDQSWPSLNMSQSSMFGEISDDLSFPWSSSVHCTCWKLWQTMTNPWLFQHSPARAAASFSFPETCSLGADARGHEATRHDHLRNKCQAIIKIWHIVTSQHLSLQRNMTLNSEQFWAVLSHIVSLSVFLWCFQISQWVTRHLCGTQTLAPRGLRQFRSCQVVS